MARYAIWDKISPMITPVGKILSAEQWKERYPVATLDNIKVVCGGGEINGSFFSTFGQMIEMYTKLGCDFSDCEADQDYLNAIEAFEDEMNKPSTEPTTDERIAAALEYQVMMSLPDEEA